MSRTDAHAPVAVRMRRGEVGVVEQHDHTRGPCDLPSRPPVLEWPVTTRCRWTFDGVARVCSCTMCHGGWWARFDNRRERRTWRRRLADLSRLDEL